jgi:hypothetical protein
VRYREKRSVMPGRSNAPWPTDDVDRLRAWRHDGISNLEIGKRLGRSKFAVKAKIRALRLPRLKGFTPRPPQQQQLRKKPAQSQRAGKTTLPPLASLQDD